MKKIILIILMLLFISIVNVVNADIILGNPYYDSVVSNMVAVNTGGDEIYQLVLGLEVIIPFNCTISSINGYFSSTSNKGDVICGIYNSQYDFIDSTSIIRIDISYPTLYSFNFSTPLTFYENDVIYVVAYGNQLVEGATTYIYGVENTPIRVLLEYQNNFPVFHSTFSPQLEDHHVISLYAIFEPTIPSCGSTAITFYNNTQHTTGKYQYSYSTITGYNIWLNFTGAIPTFVNYLKIRNATGTFTTLWSYVLWKYTTWANYTGNTTSITWNNAHINTTWSHIKKLLVNNSWLIYDNDTGNITGGTYISSFHMFVNLIGVMGFINWTGDINSSSMNISFNVTSDMNITGHANINDTDNWLYLGSTVTLDNFTILLIYLFALMYFIYNNKTNDLFIGSYSHIIFILCTVIMLLSIELGQFIIDLGLTSLQRAMLLPFILVFIGLMWLFKKPKKPNE